MTDKRKCKLWYKPSGFKKGGYTSEPLTADIAVQLTPGGGFMLKKPRLVWDKEAQCWKYSDASISEISRLFLSGDRSRYYNIETAFNLANGK